MLTPKLIPMEKMEQLEKTRTKEQQDKGLDTQTQATYSQQSPKHRGETMDRAEELYREGGGIRGDEEYGPHTEAEKRGRGGIRAKRAVRRAQQENPFDYQMEKAGPTKGFGSSGKKFTTPEGRRVSTQAEAIRGGGSASKPMYSDRQRGMRQGFDTDFYRRTKVVNNPVDAGRKRRNPPAKDAQAKTQAATEAAGLVYAPKMEKQRLDDAAVQLEKILGIGRRGMKESEKYDRAGQSRWGARRRRLDAERADVKRKAGAVGGAAKEGVGRAAGAAAGAAYGATGAAERGTKRAGSLLSRAFGAGKRKAQDVAGAPGRRQERKASERHQSNLRQQATAKRVAASEDRRDARKQSPTTVQQGRTGYTNGHDTALGGKQGERSAAIAPFKSPSKIQQTDAASGKAPQQPKPYTPAKPKWGESGFASGRGDWKAMEKAMVSLQKYLDDCGCEGDSLMQNARTKEQQRRGQHEVANVARSKAFSGLTQPDYGATKLTADDPRQDDLKRANRKTIKFGERDAAATAKQTPLGRRRQRYESGKKADAEIAQMEANSRAGTSDAEKYFSDRI